jgi:hypothetical protein
MRRCPVRRYETPLVGRERELRLLTDAFERAVRIDDATWLP